MACRRSSLFLRMCQFFLFYSIKTAVFVRCFLGLSAPSFT
ncbi:putative membrane protein [Collimonas pratensis]|uniref:Membrane protein n=1 Tax=Collimonas pratensis TaxID=279113 RepID=A0A127Q6P3_9BURK|nr:putative membrane protein [Collimonas pratensis]AMP14488.1 putative membrane protein [Collimonas pratensis]